MSNPLSKEQLRFIAECLHRYLPRTISFSVDGVESMTASEIADRIRPLDAQLADKLVAWNGAATGLSDYLTERLDKGGNPMAVNEDMFILKRSSPKGGL